MTASELASRLNGQRTSYGWKAKCPAHEDRTPSLSIGEGTDGRVLLKCFAGCPVDAILTAAQLKPADLFAEGGRGDHSPRKRSNTRTGGITLAQYAAAKRLPIEFLEEFGLSDFPYLGAPAVRIPYRDEHGRDIATQFRLSLHGKDRFRWRAGSRLLPYGLWQLRGPTAASIVLVEGASDVQTLRLHDVDALGLPGASTWQSDWDPYVERFSEIYVLLEPDQGGEAVYGWITRSTFRDRVRFITLNGAKDPSDLYLRAPDSFLEKWQSAQRAAVPWATLHAERLSRSAAEYYAVAAHLLDDPRLLDRIGEAIRARGYAGDLNAPLLVYAALTSRELNRPQNLAVIAPSAAGKNRAVDAALELVPPEAVHIVSAGSARALIYSEQSFEHRVVIFGEADSIPENGPAASAIRSIAADGRMVYEVAEKNVRTGRCETRRIEKRGPTGIITTGTRSLGAQMGTRMLEVSLRDDAAQTRQVMKAHARSVQPQAAQPCELGAFIALQRWLTVAGEKRVSIPYASVLADLVPSAGVRMRRDFRQLLTMVETIAFLHQRRRPRSFEGWVVATIEDYAIARTLLESVFEVLSPGEITPAVRETVSAVAQGEQVSEVTLCRRLGLSKATISYRVKRALDAGFLTNLESRQGHPARLVRGVELPRPISVLPSTVQLREAFECSNGIREEYPPSPTSAASGEPFECSNQIREQSAPSPPPFHMSGLAAGSSLHAGTLPAWGARPRFVGQESVSICP